MSIANWIYSTTAIATDYKISLVNFNAKVYAAITKHEESRTNPLILNSKLYFLCQIVVCLFHFWPPLII